MDADDDLSFLIPAAPTAVGTMVPNLSAPSLVQQVSDLRQRLMPMESMLMLAQDQVSSATEAAFRKHIAQLEAEADGLSGDEQTRFVNKHRAQRLELIDKIDHMPTLRVKLQEQRAEVEAVRRELAHFEALLKTEQADAQEAELRMARYNSMYRSRRTQTM